MDRSSPSLPLGGCDTILSQGNLYRTFCLIFQAHKVDDVLDKLTRHRLIASILKDGAY